MSAHKENKEKDGAGNKTLPGAKDSHVKLHAAVNGLQSKAGGKPVSMRPLTDDISVVDINGPQQEHQSHQIELEMQLKRVQADLEESKAKYAALYDYAPVAYFTLDSNGLILEANHAAADQFGIERDSLAKKPFPYFVVKEDQNTFLLHCEKVLEKKTKQNCEIRLRKNDGMEFIAELESTVEDSSGCKQINSYLKDITERKHLCELLQESEIRFRELFNNISSGVAVYKASNNGEDFIFQDINKAAEKISKVRREQLIGKNVIEIFPFVKEFGLLKIFQQVWKAGKPQHFPVSLYKDDRVSHWVDNYVYKLPCGDIVAVYDDVTEHKRATETLKKNEELYRTVVEDVPALICRFLPDGALTFVNEHYCQYFARKCEELEGHNFFDFIPEEERKNVRRHYMSLTPEKPTTTYEHKVTSPGGTTRWQLWTDRAIFDDNKKPMEYQSIGIDITDRKTTEQLLRESEETLREQKTALEQKNIALKEMIEQINIEKNKLKEDIAINIENNLMPILSKIKMPEESQNCMELLKHHLEELASSFGRKITDKNHKLTPKEIEICNMIKGGLTSKEVCKLMGISNLTVEKHRRNIRKKLGLSNKNINLASYLRSI